MDVLVAEIIQEVVIGYDSGKGDCRDAEPCGVAQDAEGRLSFQGLEVHPSFSGYHEVCSFCKRIETDRFQNHLSTRRQSGSQESEQCSAQASGCPSSGDVFDIDSGAFPNN